eukprot:PITA_11445
MLLKIELSKDFDKLNWTFIQKMLTTVGFSPPWVRSVMSLISSTLFSILVNGIPSTPFPPSRGIRQEDPLSPFLFVLMVEGLGRSIKNALQSQQLRVQEALKIKSLLNEISEASVASINNVKSQIFFFHTPYITQSSIARIFEFSVASLPSKYLDAPITDSALEHSSWKLLLEKLETRLFSWTYRALNMASRLVLVKVVLQSMPLYIFSVLAAPKWVLKKIKNLQRIFL